MYIILLYIVVVSFVLLIAFGIWNNYLIRKHRVKIEKIKLDKGCSDCKSSLKSEIESKFKTDCEFCKLVYRLNQNKLQQKIDELEKQNNQLQHTLNILKEYK